MVGSLAMEPSFFVRNICSARFWRFLAVALLFVARMPSAYAQVQDPCREVGFAKRPISEYSPESLKNRVERDPMDVDALIHLGLHVEEQDQDSRAYALYERAIQARSDCSLGYLFAGLVEERISGHAASDAEVKMHKALSLDPSLRNDPNVEGFFRRHPRLVLGASSKETESPSVTNNLLGSANRFLIGVGVGLLLSAPFVYLARRKQSASG